jgi:hypothetical protein
MDFRKFLEMANDSLVEAKKKESTAEKDDKAEKAGKKVAKDIEYDEGHKGKDDKKAEKAGKKVAKDIEYDDKKDKKDKKKKSLKDWFEQIDNNILREGVAEAVNPKIDADATKNYAYKVVHDFDSSEVGRQAGDLTRLAGQRYTFFDQDRLENEGVAMFSIPYIDNNPQGQGQYGIGENYDALADIWKYRFSGKQAQGWASSQPTPIPTGKKTADGDNIWLFQFGFAIPVKGRQFEQQGVAESVPPGMKPMAILDPANKEAGAGVLSSTNPAIQKLLGNLDPKDVKIVMTKTAVAPPASGGMGAGQKPAQPGQQAGLSTGGGGTAMKEEILDEKAPPGMEDVVLSLKKKYPGEEGRAYAIAWSMYNKKHGKNEGAEDNPPSDADGDLLEAEKWIQKAIKKPGALKKQLGVPADEPIPAGKLAAAAKKGGKLGQRARLAQTLKKMHEGDIPKSGPDYGAGLGAGRNPEVLESKQVNEAMNTLEAAYHEGKSHGLSKHGYACRYNEGSEEHKRYHDGFKEGLDECYGLQPNRGLVVSEVESGQDVVDDMASFGAEEGALGEMDKTAYMKQQAIKTPGNTFKAFGQTMHDKDVLEADAFAFESLDKQLNALLNEETLTEGLSVNMSQGLGGPGGQMEDTVSVTAQGDDAGKLLAFIKQVGLGGLGADKPEMTHGEPVVAVASDYGAPKFGGYDQGSGGMMDLIKKVSGGEDYKDEEGEEHGHDHDHAHEGPCNECGMMEADCGCDKVEETQTPDQMTDDMAEGYDDDGYEGDEADAAKIDASMPASGGAVNEGGDGGEAGASDAADAVDAADTAEEEEEAVSEGEKLDEWANEAGHDGTEASFERDIEFMTKIIAGGLNKPKSTGQQTIPVLAGDKERTREEALSEWMRLAGLGK